MAVDLYSLVPKDLEANLQYRIDLRKRCDADLRFRQAMLTACQHDICFWLSAFCYVWEPRPRLRNGKLLPKTVPFIPWDHQVPVIRQIKANLGFRDIGFNKSRGEGASWIVDYLALHDWLFEKEAKVGLVSNTEKKTDDPGNMDSLMAKIDWAITKLPVWMVGVKDVDWERRLSDHSFVHRWTGSQINGFAASQDTGRGGRYKWFAADELGAWDRPVDKRFMESVREATDSRLVISTPYGSEGAYYEFVHTPSSALMVVLDWKDNPSKNRGLYRIIDNKPVAVDPISNPLLPEYDPPTQDVLDLWSRLRLKGFKLEGRDRSPWYDGRCDRPDSTPQSIAQELDRDFGGSMYRIFGAEFFEQSDKTCRDPYKTGNLTFDRDTLEPSWNTVANGPCKLWCTLDRRGFPEKHPYAVGVDIGSGLGGSYTSNSVITVFDLVKMEQVFEYSSNTVEPVALADMAIAVATWFDNAYLAWERNGPGNAFTKQIKARLGKFNNVYYEGEQLARGSKKTKKLGWLTTKQSKEYMFGEFLKSIRTGEITIRSKDLNRECGQYVRLGGKIEHVGAFSTEDESSMGESHGDRVIAACVALQAIYDRPLDYAKMFLQEMADNPPPHTMAARLKEYEDTLEKQGDVWDDRTNWDLSQGRGMVGHAR